MRRRTLLLLAAVALLGIVVRLGTQPGGPFGSSSADRSAPRPAAGPSAAAEGNASETGLVPPVWDGAILVTVVRAVDGSLIPGARVEIQSKEDLQPVGTTNESGTVRLANLPVGHVLVRACANGHARSPLRKLEPGLRIALAAGVVLEGTVVDRTDGKLLAGADALLWAGGTVVDRFSARISEFLFATYLVVLKALDTIAPPQKDHQGSAPFST